MVYERQISAGEACGRVVLDLQDPGIIRAYEDEFRLRAFVSPICLVHSRFTSNLL